MSTQSSTLNEKKIIKISVFVKKKMKEWTFIDNWKLNFLLRTVERENVRKVKKD